MSVCTHVPHQRTVELLEHKTKPVTTADVYADVYNEKASPRFNSWLAVKITDGVGTMPCPVYGEAP